MAYQNSVTRRQRFAAITAAFLLVALVGWAISEGMNVQIVRKWSQAMTAIQLPLPVLPPSPSVATATKDQAASGKAAPPNIKAEATAIEAPKPIIPPPQPIIVAAAPKAGDGQQSQAGTASTPGPGTGVGGAGDGLGSGGHGTGRGGGGSRPVWQSGTISDRDYPRSASSARRGGDVEVRFTIQPSGRVSGCRIHRSSGDAALDATTCRLIEQRFRFRPATNDAGVAISSSYGWRQSWWLEKRR